MVNQLKLIIIVAIISTTIPTITAFVLHDMQEQSVQEELQQLRTQNDILKDTLDDQQKQTEIMNKTLTNLQKSLKKESLISVKVLPHTEELYNPFGAGYKIEGGQDFTREIFQTKSSIPLKENQTMIFDIIITNVGADTAILNGYQVQIYTDIGPSGSSWSTNYRDIRDILEANSSPMIIPFELEITPKFAPRGEMFFVVSHDNGVSESYSLKYFYDD